MLKEQYLNIQEQIKLACQDAHRDVESVQLLAVSKFHTAQAVAEIALLGHRNFAESYLKEAKEKRKELENILPKDVFDNLIWHSIGHIQTNKAKDACTGYEYIHALDSERLATALSNVLEKKEKIQKVLIEVNIGEEPQKAGILPDSCPKLIEHILALLPNLSIQGFMCLPPLQTKSGENRRYFHKMYEIKNSMERLFDSSFPQLSMGTSSDYKEAIHEGATFVRIGTDIFGERPKHI